MCRSVHGKHQFISGAGTGNIRASLSLCEAYYFGEGVPRDIDEALHHCTLALERGRFVHAAYMAGFIYMRHKTTGWRG
jgi:TPR repeat protein